MGRFRLPASSDCRRRPTTRYSWQVTQVVSQIADEVPYRAGPLPGLGRDDGRRRRGGRRWGGGRGGVGSCDRRAVGRSALDSGVPFDGGSLVGESGRRATGEGGGGGVPGCGRRVGVPCRFGRSTLWGAEPGGGADRAGAWRAGCARG